MSKTLVGEAFFNGREHGIHSFTGLSSELLVPYVYREKDTLV